MIHLSMDRLYPVDAYGDRFRLVGDVYLSPRYVL